MKMGRSLSASWTGMCLMLDFSSTGDVPHGQIWLTKNSERIFLPHTPTPIENPKGKSLINTESLVDFRIVEIKELKVDLQPT